MICSGPSSKARFEGLVAAVGDVVVDALGVDLADPAQQDQVVVAGLGNRHRRRGLLGQGGRSVGVRPHDLVGGGGRDQVLDRGVAGLHGQRGGRALADAEARAVLPAGCGACRTEALLEGVAHLLGAACLAGDVGADVDDPLRARLGGEQRVERRDAVDVRRRHAEPPADVVERTGADPADPVVHRMQRLEHQVALRARLVAAVGPPMVEGAAVAAVPAAVGRADQPVDGVALVGAGFGVGEGQVQGSDLLGSWSSWRRSRCRRRR